MSIITHKKIKGVFIDRCLNFHTSEYYIKDSMGVKSYKLAEERKKFSDSGRRVHPKKNKDIVMDEMVDWDYVDNDRKY